MREQGITTSARPGPVHRRRRRILISVAAIVAVTIIAQWPVTTRFGVNYAWSSKRIPLYEKAINFISRDLQVRRLTQEITVGATTEEDKLLQIFSWVSANVRPVPDGLTVVDDHPLHILIRGYGADDQRVEAFTLLAGYAGFHAVSVKLLPPGARRNLLLALVRTGGRTLAFDVAHGVQFRNEQGQLADVSELLERPALIQRAAPGLVIHNVPYEQYVLEFRHAQMAFSRTDAQKVWPRLVQEVSQWFGIDRLPSHDKVKL